MALKATKKPGSLTAMNKSFMAKNAYQETPAPVRTGSLAGRPSTPTAAPQVPSDIVETFNGLRQQATPQGYRRPITRRGLSGAELDANGNDPGSGINWMDRNNSPAQIDARNARQAELDSRRAAQMQSAGASAVAERKALQEMGQAPFQLAESNRAANSVKGNDGYMTLFDGKGNAVGTNRPMAKRAFDAGTSSTNPMNPNLQQQIQQGFNQDASQPRAKASVAPASFLDTYATPGGSNASVVGAQNASGTPGGGKGGIAPVDYFGAIDTSGAPKAPVQSSTMIFKQPAPAENYRFEQQIAENQPKRPSTTTLPYSDPFVGAPYGGKLSAGQQEVLGLFAPKTTGGMFGAPRATGRVRSGNTNAMDTVLPGSPGQLGWPMLSNKDVSSFSQFFPGMNWSADYGDTSRARIQQNFDQLIRQNLIRVGPDGNYQIVPQNPLEKMLSSY